MVKFYLLLFIAVISISQVFAQEQSENEYTGDWTSNGSWQDGSAPPTTGISDDITINGLITAPSLSFAANSADLILSDGDTLIIEGNLNMNSNNAITIGSGAILVVTGDLDATGNFIAFNAGTVLVIGQTSVNGSTNIIDAGGSLYLLGGHNLDDSDFDSGTVEDNVDDQDDLNNNDSDLVTYLDTNHGTTLPVELIYFKAFTEREWVRLEWVTATEVNNDYFAIERAKGDLNFQEISTVKGNGTTSRPIVYQAEDKNPPNGQLYYRLRQVDFDGSQHFHQVVSVNVNNTSTLNLYPNPSSDGIFQCTINEKVQNVVYISTLGNRYPGVAVNKDGAIIISSAQPLPSGMYLIRIQTEHKVYFADVIIR